MSLHTFHAELRDVVVTNNELHQKTDKFPDNASMCLQHVCVRNVGKTNAWAVIGFITGDQIMWVGAIKCATNGKYYSQDFNVFFKGARGIVVWWQTADASDKVEAYVYGYYRD